MKKLGDARRSVGTFLRRMRTLGDKLGPILFQLPPRRRFTRERLVAFPEALSGPHA
jgi:uncharacterized protein YecE (DUF72 family)